MKNLIFFAALVAFSLSSSNFGHAQFAISNFSDNGSDNNASHNNSNLDLNVMSDLVDFTIGNKSSTGSYAGSVLVNGNWMNVNNDFSQSNMIGFNRTFNSMSNIETSLGKGWSSNWDMHLKANALGDVYFVDAEGRMLLLIKNKAENNFTPDNKEFPNLVQENNGTYVLTKENGDTYKFNEVGKVTMINENNGEKLINLSYDNSGYLTEVNGESGKLKLVNDNEGNLIKVINDKNEEVNYSYDSENLLSEITFSDNSTITYTYDENGRLTSMVDRLGDLHLFEFDNKNRIVKRTNAIGETQTFSYPKSLGIFPQNVQVYENNEGETWVYRANERGKLVKIEYPDGSTKKLKYDNAGNIVDEIYSDATE
jgi:YD repeat-containing protein